MSLWNDLANPVFAGVLLAGFKTRVNAFLLASAARSNFVLYFFPFLFILFISVGLGGKALAGVYDNSGRDFTCSYHSNCYLLVHNLPHTFCSQNILSAIFIRR